MLINTIKWEALDHWRYSIRWTLLGALALWLLAHALLFILPDFSFQIADTYISIRPDFLLSVFTFVGAYLMFIYPLISTVHDVAANTRVSERLINRHYAVTFVIKLLFNVFAYLLGYALSLLAPGGGLYVIYDVFDIIVQGPQFSIFRAALFFPTSVAFFIVAYKTILAKGIAKVFSLEGVISLVVVLLLVFNGVLNLPNTFDVVLFAITFIMISFLYEKRFEI